MATVSKESFSAEWQTYLEWISEDLSYAIEPWHWALALVLLEDGKAAYAERWNVGFNTFFKIELHDGYSDEIRQLEDGLDVQNVFKVEVRRVLAGHGYPAYGKAEKSEPLD